MPDQPFTDLYRDTENLTWAPVEQVRRRGRQRTLRTRAAATLSTVVAVAAVATGAAVLADGRDATPPLPPATGAPTPTPPATPTPASSPAPTEDATSESPASGPAGPASREVPPAALLAAGDLPDGFRKVPWTDGDWSLDATSTRCRNAAPPLTVRKQAERGAAFRAAPEEAVVERVRRYASEDAKVTMDRARRLVTGCRPHDPEQSLAIVDSGFAGDESLLVAATGDGTPSRWLLVRRGDLVAEVWLKGEDDPAEARRIAQRVAERLCAGTEAC
ncbi:hypothetical protein [Micromonospora sp. NPDC007220]